MSHSARQTADGFQPLRFPQLRLGLRLRPGVACAQDLKLPAPHVEVGPSNLELHRSTIWAETRKFPSSTDRSAVILPGIDSPNVIRRRQRSVEKLPGDELFQRPPPNLH